MSDNNEDKKKKKKKRPLDDLWNSTPDIVFLDRPCPDTSMEIVSYTPDMVEEHLDFPVELCGVDKAPRKKAWTKPAYNLLLNKVTDLNKDWQAKTIDSISHTETDFTNLNAQESAIAANDFTNADFSNAKFNRARIAGGNYKNCKFINNLFSSAMLGHVVFEDCLFENVDFNRTSFKRVIFRDCKFSKCSFISTELHTTDLYDCNVVESLFNTELWYLGNIKRTKISNSEFNKSQFSHILMKGVTLTDNSLLKATFFKSEIRESEFKGNAWLKVGFANGNSFMSNMLYNENIQQCNFMDSEWKQNEFQESQMLKNDFSEIDLYETDFVGVKGLALNLARGVITNCKFVDCDLGGSNCTSADFICGSSMTNCSLDRLIYAYADMPEGYESQLKIPSTAQIQQLEDKDLKMGFPSTTAEINTPKATVAGVSNGYRYYGTMSISGDMTVTDTESLYSNVTLSEKKVSIENSISEEIQKWLHNDYGKTSKDQDDSGATIMDVVTSFDIKQGTINLNWKFGNYSFKPEIFIAKKDTIYIKGSVTKNNDTTPIDNRFISSSSLTINIDMNFNKDSVEAKHESNSFLSSYILVPLRTGLFIGGTVVGMLPHPVAKGFGFGMRTMGGFIPVGS